ncbi:MAG: tripartite tricarboxylate transporter permease [Candidatus Micrarchaeota archaeon]
MPISPLILSASLLFSLAVGLLPGLHPNSIGAILGNFLAGPGDWPFFLIILLGGRMVLQFLPSIFLGIPDGEIQATVLPGQRMFMQGRAGEAMLICAFSAVAATLAAVFLSPFLLPFLPAAFSSVKPFTGPILLLAALISILVEKDDEKRVKSAVVFSLAWALGQIVLGMAMVDPLFPLFVGFFTMPMLLSPVGQVKEPPPQTKPLGVGIDILPCLLLGVLLGALADLLPGISTPAQIALFASLFISIQEARHFLALVASIEASHSVFALTSSAAVGVARVGAVAMAQAATPITPSVLPSFLGAFLLSVALSALAAIFIAQEIAKHWHSIDWHAFSALIAAYLILMVLLNGGPAGLAVLVTASAIGALPILWGVRRTQVMGSLVGPSMVYAFGRVA